MSRHTAGPWVSEPERRFREQAMPEAVGVRGPGGTFVAAAFDFNRTDRDAEVEANARLIAAAPDLLEALKEIARMATQSVHTDFAPELLRLIERESRAAIAKARGDA